MAGAFTHLIISDIAKSQGAVLGNSLKVLLNRHYPFLFLGSVSPDLPYLSLKTGDVNWADVMHYEKTNSIAISGHKVLKDKWHTRAAADEAKFAWLMGYISHLVADATIHPVVQAIVGDYEEHKTEHRLCEMSQDSLIYHLKRNDDIRYTEFSDMIRFCRETEHFDEVLDFWKNLITANYEEKAEEPHPKLWFTTYAEAIDSAEGDSSFCALFRHVGLDISLFYKTKAEIESSLPQDYERYYSKIRLPGGGTGAFERDGFDRAVANVAAAWKELYEGLTSPLIVDSAVRNWNLDTGVDMEVPDGKVTYWT
jgi:hypothetical protein